MTKSTQCAQWRDAECATSRASWRWRRGRQGRVRGGLPGVWVLARGLAQALSIERRDGAPMHAAHDFVELFVRRRRSAVQCRRPLRLPSEDAVEHHRMEVHVEIDARPESLHERHGARGRVAAEPLALWSARFTEPALATVPPRAEHGPSVFRSHQLSLLRNV